MMSERQVSSHNGEISQTSHRVINDTILISDSDDSNDSNDGVKVIHLYFLPISGVCCG